VLAPIGDGAVPAARVDMAAAIRPGLGAPPAWLAAARDPARPAALPDAQPPDEAAWTGTAPPVRYSSRITESGR
jgi:hypothetical protein